MLSGGRGTGHECCGGGRGKSDWVRMLWCGEKKARLGRNVMVGVIRVIGKSYNGSWEAERRGGA